MGKKKPHDGDAAPGSSFSGACFLFFVICGCLGGGIGPFPKMVVGLVVSLETPTERGGGAPKAILQSTRLAGIHPQKLLLGD